MSLQLYQVDPRNYLLGEQFNYEDDFKNVI